MRKKAVKRNQFAVAGLPAPAGSKKWVLGIEIPCEEHFVYKI